MGKYPITRDQYFAIMGKEAYGFYETRRDGIVLTGGDQFPAVDILWGNAQDFCNKLSEKTDKNFELPSNEEWEYACRAGTKTKFHFGDVTARDVASGGDRTVVVGSFPANDFGLYDMHSNVSEWCRDTWDESYHPRPMYNVGHRDGTAHLMRGGSGMDSSDIWVWTPACGGDVDNLGFRVIYSLNRVEQAPNNHSKFGNLNVALPIA
jgi:formylglycine-generating enzyme required for sulfatase activity